MYNTEFCKVEYLENVNAVFCQWKKKCSFDDYRKPFEYGLKLIDEKKATIWITDTTYGFENELEDTQWLLESFIPQTISSVCNSIYFIIKKDSPLKNEIDTQSEALSQFFIIKQFECIDDIK